MRVLSLASFMVPQHGRSPRPGVSGPLALLTAILTLSLGAAACDKMPLLAPAGTVITIFPTATNVPANGSTEIVATVIENGTTATPPTNGGTGTTSTTGSGTP